MNSLKINRKFFDKKYENKLSELSKGLRNKIDIISKHELFGEIGVLTNLYRTCTVVARENTVF